MLQIKAISLGRGTQSGSLDGSLNTMVKGTGVKSAILDKIPLFGF